MVHDEPFQGPNGQGTLHILPPTGIFTWMGTDIGADGSNHIISLDHFQGFLITALEDEAYIAPSISAYRTSGSTWRK
jgi:hypothetical protein